MPSLGIPGDTEIDVFDVSKSDVSPPLICIWYFEHISQDSLPKVPKASLSTPPEFPGKESERTAKERHSNKGIGILTVKSNKLFVQ